MTWRRSAAGVLLLALGLIILSAVPAFAEYRGTDMWSNLTPGGGRNGLADRYPLSYYQLDYYVDVGITSPDGIPAMIGQWMSSQLFALGALVMRGVISIFDWSSELDMVTGSGGGLSKFTGVVEGNYQTLIIPFVTTALLCFGIWIAFKTVRNKQHAVGSALLRVMFMSVVAIAISFHPQETLGRLYSMADDMADAIISAGGGSPSDRMFDTFVYRPFAVLQHGGTHVCTGAQRDEDGFPLAATDKNPAKTCHDVLNKDTDNHGNYMAIMMRYAPGSKERKEYYDALREGKPFARAPDMTIDKTDAPAVDMMQAGGAGQRFIYVLIILAGMAGGILLLGLIVVAKLFSQIALLMLFYASPFMILAALYPGFHGIVESWLKALGKVLVSAVVYTLLMSIVLNTSRAIMELGGDTGFALAFFFQSLLFLGVFFKRKVILEMLTTSKTAKRYSHHESSAVSFTTGAATGSLGVISSGMSDFASTMRQGWTGGNTSSSSDDSVKPDMTSPPVSAGRDYSPGGEAPSTQEEPVPSSTDETLSSTTTTGGSDMKQFREALAERQAQANRKEEPSTEETGQQSKDRYPDMAPPNYGGSPEVPEDLKTSRIASASSLAAELSIAMLSKEAPVPNRIQKSDL